jgi:hypothetical protein
VGKGSNTTTTQSTSSADPQAAQAYRDLITRAQGVASTPYQAYSGELTAPVNSQQQAGIAGINSNANYASPYISQAAGLTAGAANPLTQQQIQSYLNPYTQNVVDATNAQMMHDNGVQMAGLQGNQIAQGALGGNATGVAKGILAGQNARTMASTDANLYSQGYQGALNTAYQQYQQNPMAAGNALANYGVAGQNAALTGASAQVGAGSLLQQSQQAADTAGYNQYAQAQAYPYQQTQWLSGIATGVGSNLGGTSNGTTTGPAPNPTAQWLGTGLAAAGLFAANGGAIRARAFGGGVSGYADGGAPAQPWGGVAGWIPQMSIHGGSGAPHAGAPSLPSQSGSQVDPAKFASGITGAAKGLSGLGDRFNALMSPEAYGAVGTGAWGAGAYGGSSASPLSGLSADDYGEGFADGGAVAPRPYGVAGYAGGGDIEDLQHGDPSWDMPDVVGDTNRSAGYDLLRKGVGTRSLGDAPRGDMPVFGPDGKMMGNQTSAQGVAPAAEAPVVAEDDDEADTPASRAAPTGVAGRPPVMASDGQRPPNPYYAAPDAVTPPESSSFGLGLISPNAKTGLLAAGLGMLASRSPFLGNAVGEGGLAGVGAYGAANEHDRKVAAEASKLSQEARQKNFDNWLKTTTQAETARHNRATEEKEFKPQLIHHPDPATGQELYGTYNPNTRKIEPLEFPSGSSKGAERYVSQAPPVQERRRAPAASPEARDEGYMKWLDEHRPPGYADVVRGVADYEMDPNRVESLQKGQRSQLYRDAKLYDPTYDQTHFAEKTGVINSFSRGADRAAVNSLNVAVSHLGTLKDLGAALKNGNFPIVNRIFNQAGIQLGGQNVTNFNAAKEIVGDEVVKAIVGGVSAQADRDAIKHLIMAQQSPEQLQGTINTFTALLGGQLEGRRLGYQAGTGLNNFDQKYLSPETREALTRIKVNGGHVDPTITRMVWPSGIPKPDAAQPGAGGGFVPPAGAIPRVYQGRTYYYDPNTKQPYAGQ